MAGKIQTERERARESEREREQARASESKREQRVKREREKLLFGAVVLAVCCVGVCFCFVFDRLCVNSVSVHCDCAGRG